ncbi:hypothetical protein F0562_001071 [Nyssa sinensis]|uniref:Retrovirus-related Pol polyprotein from transposon TNT 1-94-like beta-barrel domain-containing protein n=1 Tax=Nyssa sinensis TaxID=561372 RepID=A0A5J5C6A2_9ASTE|nr:hypothetical protein F0562_001071 [Nyssa sinensis]
MWAVRMETYLDALDLWEAVEEDYEVQPLPTNPSVAQIKTQKEKRTRKSKAKACLFAAVSPTIFTKIMSLKSAKDIWDYLKEEYARDERIKGMQVLNLVREFELQRMKDSETITDYSDRLLSIVKQVICKEKAQQQKVDAQVSDQEDKDQLFVASCFASSSSTESWLIDNGCTNHMTNDKDLFRDLRPTDITKVRIGNGDYISVKGKWTITISSRADPKKISDVLYGLEIDQNLLSEILRMRMKGKSFSFDPIKEELAGFPTETSNIEIWHKRLSHCHLQSM